MYTSFERNIDRSKRIIYGTEKLEKPIKADKQREDRKTE
jgi:hypothetical protein